MDISAFLIRNVYFPLMENLKGNKIRKNLRYLKETEKKSRNEILELQRRKLIPLLSHCLAKVPAYAEFKPLLSKVEADPYGVLRQLPVLTKQHFRLNSELYFPEGQSKEGLIPNSTGGSTGEPLKFYMDRRTVEFYEAARWRGLSWWGINIGDPSVMIWGSPHELTKLQNRSYQLKERYLKNRIILPAHQISELELKNYVRLIDSFKPHYFYGYASALYFFAKLLLKHKLLLKGNYKGVVSTAETLYAFQRETIEKAFGCPVINEYGARDGGIISYQCPEGKMHLTAENAVVELLDIDTMKPVGPGESGLVVITDLNNFVMPRLRYQVGDVATWGREECRCGLGLPVLGEIQGREVDIFLAADGKYVHGSLFSSTARNLDGIAQFQIVQRDPQHLHLKIVKTPEFKEKEVEYFIRRIKEVMGNLHVELEYVEKIPASASGKIRYAIRDFPLK